MENRLRAVVNRHQAATQEQTGRAVTQDDIARGAGVDPGTLSRYVNDQTKSFRRDIIEKLCQYFNVPIQEILYVEIDKDNQAQ